MRVYRAGSPRALIAAGIALAAGNAVADCDRTVIKWLQSKGFTPAEAMEWCDADGRAPTAIPAPKAAFRQERAPITKEARAAKEEERVAKLLPQTLTLPAPQAQDQVDEAVAEKIKQDGAKQMTPLSSFKTSSSKGAHLVTAHIATAYSPAFQDRAVRKGVNGRWYNGIGVDISASMPADSTTLQEYAKQAVMRLDGGVLNLYAAFAGRNLGSGAYGSLSSGTENPRNLTFDHIYFDRNHDAAGKPIETNPTQMLGYIMQGIGVRGVKTALEGDGYAGLATAYLGLGIDGPLLSGLNFKDKDPTAGWISIEGYGMAHAMNSRTLETLYGAPTSRPGSLASAGG